MSTLADRLRAAIEERRALAEAVRQPDGSPSTVLARCKADLAILDEHAAYWGTVEWPHDQNGKGKAMVCRRCQNADYTDWNPPAGQAGVLPEGFVTPYVVAPCRTVILLAEAYGITEETP